MAERWCEAARQHTQKQREDHDSDAIIEQRLTSDHEFQLFRRAGRLQYAHHGDRVRRRDQGTEQQAVHRRQLEARQRQHHPDPESHDQRRRQRAQNSQRSHRQAVGFEFAKVNMKRGGKQQQRQHALHEHVRKVDRAKE